MAWIRQWQFSAETRSLSDLHTYSGSQGWAQSEPATISEVNKYSGGYSYKAGGYTASAFGRQFDGSYQTMRANFMLYHEGTGGVYEAPVPIIAVLLSGVPCMFYWDWNSTQIGFLAGWVMDTFDFRYPLTSIPDTLLRSTQNRWASIGVAGRFSDTDGYLVLYIDGYEAMAWRGNTSVYAKNTITPIASANGCYAVGGGQGYGLLSLNEWKNTYVDDFYIDTSTDAEPENAPPLRRFLPAYVTGAGDNSEWSPIGAATNHEAIGDPVSDEETTYVKAGVPGLTDAYALSPVEIPDNYVVRSIIPIADVLKTNAAMPMYVRLFIKKGGEVTESTDKNLPVDFGGFVWERLASNFDGVGWTEADLQAMQVGQKSTGEFE